MNDEMERLLRAAILRTWQAATFQVQGTSQRIFVLAIASDIELSDTLDPICDLLFAAGHIPGLTCPSPYGVQVVELSNGNAPSDDGEGRS